ncbi:extensin-2-like [Aplysia californica]|uniref:Extensin-2-like n=1 Tax=Aplysia californica TaxID=6500 RepID=A0ABM0ZVW8_APLCA|nr:extensin-2-like [Aplysia californica]
MTIGESMCCCILVANAVSGGDTTSAVFVMVLPISDHAPPACVIPEASACVSPGPSAYVSSAPSAYVSPAPSAYVSSAPSAYVSPGPSAYVSSAPSTYVSTAPSAYVSTAPSAYVSTAPSAYVSTAPSAYVSSAPSASSESPTSALRNTLQKFALICNQVDATTLQGYFKRVENGSPGEPLFDRWKIYYTELTTPRPAEPVFQTPQDPLRAPIPETRKSLDSL